jgi:hypothetical protein
MRMLDASDAIATSTNLTNRLPSWVRSLARTDVTILGSAEVMCFLGFAGGRWNHPIMYTLREPSGTGDGQLPGSPAHATLTSALPQAMHAACGEESPVAPAGTR